MLPQKFGRSLYIKETLSNIVHRVCLIALALPSMKMFSSDLWLWTSIGAIRDAPVLEGWPIENRRKLNLDLT